MKVFWFHSGLMPTACAKMGYDRQVSCGWLEAMLDALVKADPTLEVCCLGFDSRPCDVTFGRVRQLSFNMKWRTWFGETVPADVCATARQAIAAFNPDVIHVQGTEYFYGRLPSDVYGKCPVVVSLQGVLSGLHSHLTGELSPDELRGCNWNLRRLLKGRTLFSEQRVWRIGRAAQEVCILRQQRNFIGRTDWDCAWTRYYNPSARYFTVNENLRSEFFAVHRESAFVRRHRLYCSACASTPLKGAHVLFRAVAALANEFPDIEVRLAAAAGVRRPTSVRGWLLDQPYFAYLRRLLRELGIERQVTLLDSLSAAQVAQELATAELFVLPSFVENSSNSLGEAMVVGTPAIATFAGGTPSILKDGKEGRLVPTGDPAALAAAIREAFRHPDMAETRAAAARTTALRRHDSRTNAEATLDVYRMLVREAKEGNRC